MRLYWFELKKQLCSVAVWSFIVICLLFNLFLVINSSHDSYSNFVGAVAKDTGYQLNDEFYKRLAQFKAREGEENYLSQLKVDTNNVTDVFDDYETEEVGEKYIHAANATGRFAKHIREKYSALQKVVDKKAEHDESLTLYFAQATYNQHKQLFHGLIGALLIEGILIAVLLMMYSVGYEHNQKTEDIVYSTKTGRNILGSKLISSLSAGLFFYALLAFITFLLYFTLNEFSGIWGSSVSNVFHYRFDYIAGYRPFITWYSFSVFTYLMAIIGMSVGVIICFSLMAFGIGVMIRNTYISFFIWIAINAFVIVFPSYIPKAFPTLRLSAIYHSMLLPVWLWLKHSLWFTDGDVDILWSHFETLGLSISILLFTVFSIIATTYFRKKDLT